MLEVFTAIDTYKKIPVKKDTTRPHIVQNIFEFLCNKGKCLFYQSSKIKYSYLQVPPYLTNMSFCLLEFRNDKCICLCNKKKNFFKMMHQEFKFNTNF